MRTKINALLTEREWNVVVAICAGQDARRKTASVLSISPRTVETHKLRIYDKLHISTTAQLILKVLDDPAAREQCFPHLRITER